MATKTEPRSFETEVALIVAHAMQGGINAWNSPSVKAMSHEQRADFMTAVTKVYAAKILDLASKKYDTKSSG